MNPNNDSYRASESNRANQNDDDDDVAGDPAQLTGIPDRSMVTNRVVHVPERRGGDRRRPLSDRERCGPIVMDRSSNLLQVLEWVVAYAQDHRTLTAESRAERRAFIASLRPVAASIDEHYASGRYEDSYGVLRPGGDAPMRRLVLAEYARTLQAIVDSWDEVESVPAGLERPDTPPQPVMHRVGWRCALGAMEEQLRFAISAVGDELGRAPVAVVYSGNEVSSWRSSAAGECFSCNFSDSSEMWTTFRELRPEAYLEKMGAPEIHSGHGAPRLVRIPFLFPRDEELQPRALTKVECLSVWAALRQVLDPFPDSVDASAVVRAVRMAAVDAEWSRCAFAVVGAKPTPSAFLPHSLGRVEFEFRSVGAISRWQAEVARADLARSGFVAVVVQTPVVLGTSTQLRQLIDGGEQKDGWRFGELGLRVR